MISTRVDAGPTKLTTRSFNEGIRRTFIGDAVGVNRFGADLTTPELLIPKIFSGGTSAGALRMGQIINGSTFASRQMDELEAQGLIPEGTPASGDTGQRLSSHSLDGQDLVIILMMPPLRC